MIYQPIASSTQITNCITIDISSGNCLNCSNGYYLNSQGQCNIAVVGCNTYDQKTKNCLNCSNGYSLSNSTCLLINAYVCKVFDVNANCV